MRDVGTGVKVFDHVPVRGRWCTVAGPADVHDLAPGPPIVAVVADHTTSYLAGLGHVLAAVVCTTGNVHSHVGIVCRELHVPCVVGVSFADGMPAEGAEVEVDCSGLAGVIRA